LQFLTAHVEFLALVDIKQECRITVSTVLYVEWGRLGEIGDLYVLPEHRCNGLARRLVEHAKSWCLAQGCSAVSVTITPVGERRHRLSQFYGKLGFTQSNRISASATLDARSAARASAYAQWCPGANMDRRA
jgi:GNAT superfamily N-acetyltransferase